MDRFLTTNRPKEKTNSPAVEDSAAKIENIPLSNQPISPEGEFTYKITITRATEAVGYAGPYHPAWATIPQKTQGNETDQQANQPVACIAYDLYLSRTQVVSVTTVVHFFYRGTSPWQLTLHNEAALEQEYLDFLDMERTACLSKDFVRAWTTTGTLSASTFMYAAGDAEKLSKSKFSCAVRKVVLALTELLDAACPRKSIQEGFYEIAGFPMVIGDCTRSPITACLGKNKGDFVKRKSFHSINIPTTCDLHHCMVTSVEAKWPGGLLLGDKGYAHASLFSMTPYPDPNAGPHNTFNVALTKRRPAAAAYVGSEWPQTRLSNSHSMCCASQYSIQMEGESHSCQPDVVDPISSAHPTGRAGQVVEDSKQRYPNHQHSPTWLTLCQYPNHQHSPTWLTLCQYPDHQPHPATWLTLCQYSDHQHCPAAWLTLCQYPDHQHCPAAWLTLCQYPDHQHSPATWLTLCQYPDHQHCPAAWLTLCQYPDHQHSPAAWLTLCQYSDHQPHPAAWLTLCQYPDHQHSPATWLTLCHYSDHQHSPATWLTLCQYSDHQHSPATWLTLCQYSDHQHSPATWLTLCQYSDHQPHPAAWLTLCQYPDHQHSPAAWLTLCQYPDHQHSPSGIFLSLISHLEQYVNAMQQNSLRRRSGGEWDENRMKVAHITTKVSRKVSACSATVNAANCALAAPALALAPSPASSWHSVQDA
ncbi:putative nuclease HARBI1 [Merluccius polli]|uniref:Nuclease HARBI1 n=1 Tax=Merluccius polli TaxID=89951 RepID=A0AA47MP52_MERPO|nr:putative nuclease HARBI1 [Merluccius polli]